MTFALSENCRLSENVECALTFDSNEVALATDSYQRIIASKYTTKYLDSTSIVLIEKRKVKIMEIIWYDSNAKSFAIPIVTWLFFGRITHIKHSNRCGRQLNSVDRVATNFTTIRPC